MADTYVLVHGAWHTGELMEPVAQHLRAKGHTVFCPTLAGNRPGDDRSATGLADAAASLVDYLHQHDLQDVLLMGHSYGGMVISHAAEQAVAGILGPAVLEQGQAVEMFIYILHRQVAFALDGNGRVAVHHQQVDLGAILAGIIAADQMLHGAMHL